MYEKFVNIVNLIKYNRYYILIQYHAQAELDNSTNNIFIIYLYN